MRWYQLLQEAAAQLLFPHFCAGCSSDVLHKDASICGRCIHRLPATSFNTIEDNPVEKIFWGRVPVQAAMAAYYFTKDSLLQTLLHELKYRRNKELGFHLGQLMGVLLKESPRFNPDVLIPVPIHPKKEKERGFNQSLLLCNGIASVLNVPVEESLLLKKHLGSSQTKKNRLERWENVELSFEKNPNANSSGKKVLLVDDVITTGATLEACGHILTEQNELQLQIACLCYTFK
jgi:ComF family protein